MKRKKLEFPTSYDPAVNVSISIPTELVSIFAGLLQRWEDEPYLWESKEDYERAREAAALLQERIGKAS